MLAYVFVIPPVWNTFIHPWRAEFAASIFLIAVLAYVLIMDAGKGIRIALSKDETKYLLLPMTALIIWSGFSVFWAGSWRSTIHHTFVWAEYLIFYIAVRQFLDRGEYRRLMMVPAGSLLFLAVLAVAAYLTYTFLGTGTTLGIVYAKYGEQVNTVFPLLIAGVVTLKGKRFRIAAAALAVIWLLIFCSFSRTNLGLFTLSASAVGLLIFAFKRFNGYRLRYAMLVGVFVAVTLPFNFLFPYLAGDPASLTAERLSDTSSIGGSNDFRKLMIGISSEMIFAHPVVGIGADNFGFSVNRYRAAYSAKNPNDPTLAQAESELPERAHNEFLQITAELGLVGLSIFMWFVAGIGVMAVRAFKRIRTASLFPFAAMTGIFAFLASSLVTSYSFRLQQNGLVFFFVLAVASRLIFGRGRSSNSLAAFRTSHLRIAAVAGITACFVLLAYTSVRVASVAYTTRANFTADPARAAEYYETAMYLDSEDPEAAYFYGLRLMEKGEYEPAVELLKRSIAIGKAPSADFSYLASAQELGGDLKGAELTFAEAAALYPRSPFVLTRYAVLLKKNGDLDGAEREFALARSIDLKQANSWWVMIAESPQAATERALKDNTFAALMDLRPQTSMYAVKAEREIRHPEEKFGFHKLDE